MDFVFDLLQGAGIAAAIGIRPFLPTLLVGALAAGDLGIDFDGTDFSFLEQAPFLAVIVVLLAISIFAVRRAGPARPGPPRRACRHGRTCSAPWRSWSAPSWRRARWPTMATASCPG